MLADYLIERLQETDGLLEVCESNSAPAGWRCNWSRKEKQYYYIHEISEEISWSYPEEDIAAVRKLASQQKRKKKKSKKEKSGKGGTLSHLTDTIEVKTVDMDLKALFLQKIVDKCTNVLKEDAVERDDPTTGTSLPKREEVKKNKKERSRRDRSRSVSKDGSSKSSKRRHSEPDSSPENTHKPKKSKHKLKDEQPDKKQKKHSKNKKSKSSGKKSKHKKQRNASSSSEKSPGPQRRKKVDYELEEGEQPDSPPLPSRYQPLSPRSTDRHSASSNVASERLTHKIFKLDHARYDSKSTKLSSGPETPGQTVLSSGPETPGQTVLSMKTTSRDPNDTAKSESEGAHKLSDKAAKPTLSDSTSTLSASDVLTKPLTSYTDVLSEKIPSPAADVSSEADSPRQPVRTPSVDLYSPSSPDFDSPVLKSSEEMDISPATSPEPLDEKTIPNAAVESVDVASSSLPKSQGHIKDEDDMDTFLQSIQNDILEERATKAAVNTTAPSPPEREVGEGLPPPKTVEQYSKAAAPVFYKPAERRPVVANTPVLYSQTAQSVPVLPDPAPAARSRSPVTFLDTTQTSESAATTLAGSAGVTTATSEANKQTKDKHKAGKKSTKKGKKMPAALVQKWQKVQSEITTDIEKEQQMKNDMFK